MRKIIFYMLGGYLFGSLLIAKYFGYLFTKQDITRDSIDGNPGAANAFHNGGFWCGFLTLCADLMKGFLPVFFYQKIAADCPPIGLAFVLAAPVVGHAFSVFHRFHGGKGIAVSFGCLLGLFPDLRPALILAVVFLLFSLVGRISPHYYRTLVTYIVTVFLMPVLIHDFRVAMGFFLIAGIVVWKLFVSTEEKGKCEVRIGWRS